MIKTTLLLAVWAGLTGAGFSVAGDDAALPSLRLTCRGVSVYNGDNALRRGRDWSMRMDWKLENASSWRIAWCAENKASVKFKGASGRSTSNVSYFYHHAWRANGSGNLTVNAARWLPGAGDRWVHAKGSVPFAVFRQEGLTDPVTVKLVKDFSVPVILKGAGLPGSDGRHEEIKAVLKLVKYQTGKKTKLELQLTAGLPLGFLDFELQTKGGLPVAIDNTCRSSMSDKREYQWYLGGEMDVVPDGEIKVMVRYAKEPQMVVATMDSRAGLSGLLDDDDELVPRSGNRNHTSGQSGPAHFGVMTVGKAAPAPSSVRAELSVMSIRSGEGWKKGVPREEPVQLCLGVRLLTEKGMVVRSQYDTGKQSLEVTDSTGRVLKPVVLNLNGLYRQEGGDGLSPSVIVDGKSPDLPSPGAEWVRLKGTLRVPVSREGKSPVYTLPFRQGAELNIPVPGMEEAGLDGDVATADSEPTCLLMMEQVEWTSEQDVEFKLKLSVTEKSFDFEEFELVDEKGAVLDVKNSDYGGVFHSDGWSRSVSFKVGHAGGMKRLGVRMKYKTDQDIKSVPVDVTVGLGGPVSQVQPLGKGQEKEL